MSSITDRVDQIFAKWDKPDSPGCSLAVIQNGEIIYKRGYGMANLEHDIPNKPETVFDIGSTSKQFTAFAILLLHRQGKLDLDDPVQKWIPELPEYSKPITIRHMVHHTSGIRDYLGLMALANLSFNNDYDEQVVIDLIARQKNTNFEPGSEYLYSNSGYFLLAEIVERASGQNMRDYMDEHAFKPLGMKNTHFHNDFKMVVKNRASAYADKEDGGFEIDMGIFDVIGDGALYTTVEDLFIWDQNFYNNKLDGGGQELIEQMHQTRKLTTGEDNRYAFGLFNGTYRGLKTVDHGGAWYGYRAQLLRFPEQQFSVICLCNLGSMSPDSLAQEVADIYLEDQFVESNVETAVENEGGIELTEEIAKNISGIWMDKQGGNNFKVSIEDSKIVGEIMGQKIYLVPLGETRFKAVEAPAAITIEISAEKKMTVDIANGAQIMKFEKVPPFTPSAEELKEFCGDYYAEELNIVYTLSEKDGMIQIKPKNEYLSKSSFPQKDTVSFELATFNFERDSKGKLTGFNVNAGRVKDIFFVKQS